MTDTSRQWRITFPIEKAETRSDGLYIVGKASGPEIDVQGQRIEHGLIYKFADQINASGSLPLKDRLPYRDWHKDGMLADLGVVTKAWVDEQTHLNVEVKLDEDNPAAQFLYKAISKGKQFGMSVHGHVLNYADEFVQDVGKMVRTFKDVVLDEISNTTKPVWTPSFGSVLSKALDEVADNKSDDDTAPAVSAQGGENIMTDALTDAQTKTESADANGAVETPVVETPAPVVEKSEEPEKAPEVPVIEKAGKRVSDADKTKLLTVLKDLGFIEVDEPATADSEDGADKPVIQKSDETQDEITRLRAANEDLTKSLAETTARVQTLEAEPRTQLPPVIEKSVVEKFNDAFAGMGPSEKMRAAFAAQTRGK